MAWLHGLQARVERSWYQGSAWLLPLVPLGLVTARIARQRYQRFIQSDAKPAVPVIIVGNITVGGTGKTPLVVALAAEARRRGFKPVVVSRGYGARPPVWPWTVTTDQSSYIAGDEPLLLAKKAGVPVVIDPQRARALDCAIRQHGATLVISDDGLQHYALPRSFEILVVDGRRGFGNGRCLPAGPLREPVERATDVDLIVINGEAEKFDFPEAVRLRLVPDALVNLQTGQRCPVTDFLALHPAVHAVAGIGHPERFFLLLQGLGLVVEAHPFPDHHVFNAAELHFSGHRPVVMTEKDAVKCQGLLVDNAWYLPVSAHLPDAVMARIFEGATV